MSRQPPQEPPEGWEQPAQGQGAERPTEPQWGQRPPQPPPRSGRLSAFLTVAVSLVGILIVAGIIGVLAGDPTEENRSGSGAQTEERQAEETETAPTEEATPGVGDAVRDGNFEFVVTAFRCSGEQCRAAMKVENIGSDPGTMFASNQYLFDDRGRRFEADDDLTDALFFEELNPGRTVSGTVIWQVPAGLVADHLELPDSAFSGGVEVKVS